MRAMAINKFKLIIWANSLNLFRLNPKRLSSQAAVNWDQFDAGIKAQVALEKSNLQADQTQFNINIKA